MRERGKVHNLVVDDEEMIRTLNRKILEREGFVVTAAAFGEQALQLAREAGSEIDLAIVDQTMPGLNGLETSRRLLALSPGIRILLCTGQQLEQEQLPEDLRSATSVIIKPYRAAQLTAMVLSILAIGASDS